jgi:hypothetical protein
LAGEWRLAVGCRSSAFGASIGHLDADGRRIEGNMTTTARASLGVSALAVVLAVGSGAPSTNLSTADHPAVGSWFGKAIQVCPKGVAPSACANGQPALALHMMPTLTADGLFFGDDSSSIVEPPYGPHTTAYGTWVPTSPTEFTTEYFFMTRTFPPLAAATSSGVRARWSAQVISADTAVGWVNAYFLDPTPVTWTPLLENEFPAFPSGALPFVAPPADFIKEPNQCLTDGCPLVFKFTLKRIIR